MTYSIQILPVAVRAIRKLPPDAQRRIQGVIELLADNPRPPAATKLTSRPEWRVRSGDWRVLYRIEDQTLTVTIVNCGHRRSIYR